MVRADDLDLRVLAQSGDHRVTLAIGQQIDDVAALAIDHDAPVAVAAAPGEVIDADDPRRWWHSSRVTASKNAQHRIKRPYRRPTGGANGSLNVPPGVGICRQRNRRAAFVSVVE